MGTFPRVPNPRGFAKLASISEVKVDKAKSIQRLGKMSRNISSKRVPAL
jgi:hypothetical protein